MNSHFHQLGTIRPTAYHLASKNKNSLSVSSPISSRTFHANTNYYTGSANGNSNNNNAHNKNKSYIDCINESISFLNNCSYTTQSSQHKLSSSQSSRKHNMLHHSSSTHSSKLSQVIDENNHLLHVKKQLEKEIEKARQHGSSNITKPHSNYDEHNTHHHHYHHTNNRHSSNTNNKHHHNQPQRTHNNDSYKHVKLLQKKKKELEYHINNHSNKINSLDHNWVEMFSNSSYIYEKLKDTVAPMEKLMSLFSNFSPTIDTSSSTLSSPNTLQNHSTSNHNNK